MGKSNIKSNRDLISPITVEDPLNRPNQVDHCVILCIQNALKLTDDHL